MENERQGQEELLNPNENTMLASAPATTQAQPQNMVASNLQASHATILDSPEFGVFYEPETKIYLTKICIIFTALVLCPILYLLTINGLANSAWFTLTALFFLFCFGLIDISVLWKLPELGDLWAESEDAFKPFEILSIICALIILYLRLENILSSSLLAFVPLVLFSIEYLNRSKASMKAKITATLFRVCYTVQIILISCKIDQYLNWDWKLILSIAWVHLGVAAISPISFMISLYHKMKLIENSNSTHLHKKLGFCWYLGYCSLPLLAMLGLYGFTRAYDSTKDFGLLKLAAHTSIAFNAFLLMLTIITRKSLIKFIISFRLIKSYIAMFQASIKLKPKKMISLQVEKKEEFFRMISPTYFVLLEQGYFDKGKENTNQIKSHLSNELNEVEGHKLDLNETQITSSNSNIEEQNLCYICCKNASDTIIIPCGHGGICYDCAASAIKEKDECTQCRKQVKAIYRVDLSSKTLDTVRGIELSRVVNKYI